MKSKEFLKSKGLILDGYSKFIINGSHPNGLKYQYCLNELLDEYANQLKDK